MKKLISRIETEIKELEELNDLLCASAMSSPFGNSVDLDEEVKKALGKMEQRVKVNLHQKGRIKHLKGLLELLVEKDD